MMRAMNPLRPSAPILGSIRAIAGLRGDRSRLGRPTRTLTYEPERVGSRPPLLDVWESPCPNGRAVLLVHGGGFAMGSRSMRPCLITADRLARAGFHVFVPDYPLVTPMGSVVIADQVVSVRRAFESARAEAHAMGAELTAILGTSAGAALSALAAARLPTREVVLAFGPYDFFALETPLLRAARTKLIGIDRADAILAVSARFLAPPSGKVLLLHGTADVLVPAEHSITYRDALLAQDREAELVLFEGAPHAFFNQEEDPICQAALVAVLRFLG